MTPFKINYEWQWNENQTPITKWQWNLFYSITIARSINTFIPLGNETINSSLVEISRPRSLMDPQHHPLLHFLVRMKPTSTNVFLQVAKNLEVTRGKNSAAQRMLKCFPAKSLKLIPYQIGIMGTGVIMQKDDSDIPGRFDFMSRRSILSHQETNHTSLLFFACLISSAGRTHFTLHSPPEQ